MAIGENKAIAVEEIGGVRSIAHHIAPESDTDSGHTDGATRGLMSVF